MVFLPESAKALPNAAKLAPMAAHGKNKMAVQMKNLNVLKSEAVSPKLPRNDAILSSTLLVSKKQMSIPVTATINSSLAYAFK